MNQVLRVFAYALVLIGGSFSFSQAQDSVAVEPPKLFLNCTGSCYPDYIKTELSFFNFVRDQAQADVQLLIIATGNASGGKLYTMTFIGQNAFAALHDTLTFATKPADTEVTVRKQLLNSLKYGLIRYVSRTPFADQVKVEFSKRATKEMVSLDDPWNYWVFNLRADAGFEGESNRREISLDNSFSARRITDKSRSSLSGYYSYDQNRFVVDEKNITVNYASYGLNARYVKSLTEHWSSGLLYALYHSVYSNTRLSQRIAPAVEYNLFPYSQNIRKQLRFAYQIGYNQISFIEETIFDRTSQGIPYHKFATVLDLTQPWGNVNTTLYASTFLRDFSRHRLGLETRLTVRLAEGLSLSVSGSASLIRDQISLAKEKASADAVLLQGRQLPTSFSYYTQVGLSYTFGSINNSIVNVRLNQIE